MCFGQFSRKTSDKFGGGRGGGAAVGGSDGGTSHASDSMLHLGTLIAGRAAITQKLSVNKDNQGDHINARSVHNIEHDASLVFGHLEEERDLIWLNHQNPYIPDQEIKDDSDDRAEALMS